MRLVAMIVAVIVTLGACSENVVVRKPEAQALTRDSIGYFCGMIVADHEGPKGQVLLANRDEALWFASVRDTIAFTRLPEEINPVAAVYVNDLSRAVSWEHPGVDAWVEIDDAVYVVGSARRGGMGAPELAPFSDRDDAELFAEQYGGEILTLGEIPNDAVLGAWDNDDTAVPLNGATR